MAKKVCEKCGRAMEDTNFYTYRDGSKFQLCKSCITMHIDNFNEETYLWILEKADVPYVPQEWNTIRNKAYAKNPKKMNGMSVLGKYLSKMKLKQFNKYHWADSEELQRQYQQIAQMQKEQMQAQADIVRQQFQNGQITESQYRTMVDTMYQKTHQYIIPEPEPDPVGQDNMFNEKNYLKPEEMPDFNLEMSLEQKQKMALKWGRTYTVQEWAELEKNYEEMCRAFSVKDPDTKNSLIFICKTNLKMNQAIDCGDLEGYQKLSRVYDNLRKSANLTALQNKEEKHQFLDSVSQLVAFCQKHGGEIPKYKIQVENDIVDKVINDMKEYNRSLVYGDSALARQIQDYIKQARAAAEKKRDREQAKEKGLDAPELSDQDILDYKDFLRKQKEYTDQEIGQI